MAAKHAQRSRLAMGVATALCLWLVGSASPAAAGRRLVLMPLSGPAGDTFTDQVADIVEPGNTLIDAGKWKRDGGTGANTPEQLRKVAAKARVDGVISGSVQRRGMGYSIMIRVRETATGETLKTINVTTATTTFSADEEGRVRKGLLAAIGDMRAIRDGGDDEAAVREDEPPPRERDVDRDDRDAKRATKKRPARDELDEDADVDEEAPRARSKTRRERDLGDDDGEAAEPLAPDKRDQLLVIRGGLGASLRRLQFTTDPLLADQPQGYLGFPVALVGAQMELFPTANSKTMAPKLRRIGLLLAYDRVLKIESRVSYRDDGGAERSVPVPTTQESFAIGAAYRWLVGKAQTGPVVQAQLRYNQLKFVFDTTTLAALPGDVSFDVPSVTYKYLDPGMGLRLPIGESTKFIVDGRVFIMMSTGDLQREDQYGATKVLGFDFDAAFDFLATKKVYIRAGFRYSRFSHTFGGNGELSNNRDNDPTDIDVSGARDSFMSGYLQSGFNF